jgi:hypothetical protein
MKTSWNLVTVSAAAAMLAACSHTVTQREVVHEQPVVQQPVVERVTVVQPPPVMQEPVPAVTAVPYPGARWVPGYWNWSGQEWVWVKGRWY